MCTEDGRDLQRFKFQDSRKVCFNVKYEKCGLIFKKTGTNLMYFFNVN